MVDLELLVRVQLFDHLGEVDKAYSKPRQLDVKDVCALALEYARSPDAAAARDVGEWRCQRDEVKQRRRENTERLCLT